MQEFYQYVLYALIGFAIGLALLIIYLVNILATITKQMNYSPENEALEAEIKAQPLLNRLLSLKPLTHEKKLLLEHSFDGIQELDNPTPPWFNFLFYGTIVFGAFYMLFYHVVSSGNVQEEEYKTEVAIAEKAKEAYMAKFANSINESNVTMLTDAAPLAEGKNLYIKYCLACHGEYGEGKVGPNLTDEYWLHGGTIANIFHTIAEGVPQKGMISWKKQLNPLQIQQVSSYILSLQGTNPPNAKAPEGEKRM